MLFRNSKLNRLLIGAIVVGLAVPLLNIFFIYPKFHKELTREIENSAIRLAKHLEYELQKNQSWHSIMGGKELPPQGEAVLGRYMENFDLSKLKIFSTEGRAVYSTNSADIGKVNTRSYFLDHVVNGEIYSKIVKKKTRSMEGQKYKEDVLEIYVPMMVSSYFVGAFELYYNVTEQTASLDRQIFNASILPFAVSGLLVFTLYWGFLRLDKSLIEKQKAEAEVTALQGIIPICMHCKGIRDDRGSWNRLEAYIEQHSGAQFSHGICESCLEEHYGEDIAERIQSKMDN